MELPRSCQLSLRAVCFLSADFDIFHTLHSGHKIMKEAVKIICDHLHTKVNALDPRRKCKVGKKCHLGAFKGRNGMKYMFSH